MRISELKIRKTNNEEKLRAYVTLTFDDVFVIHNIKIIQGKDGLFVAMPSRKNLKGEFKDIAHPINKEFRDEMEKRILVEYGAL